MRIERAISVGLLAMCAASGACAYDRNDKIELVGEHWEMAMDQYGNVSATANGTQYHVNMDSIHIVGGSTRTATISETDSRPRLREDGSYTLQTTFKSIVVGCTGNGYSHPYGVTGIIVATQQKPVKIMKNNFWGYSENSMREATYGTVQYLIAEKICSQ